ncbi:hypothetical protein AKJ09_08580 [Labilithrix luteola]|uniref:Uncharacterized protein n=1 Tax=Labilithrix luteola TaxID=1391654 RepID=A0A0K1Q8D2_9BACT|nr:hypothetical protein AKJ09_08580 [Labilithrix luteola]
MLQSKSAAAPLATPGPLAMPGPLEFPVATTSPPPPPRIEPVSFAEEENDASAPSTKTLLERAAALGPARLTFASMVMSDPVLLEKGTPQVAERRARLTRIVKATLGACVGVCVLALGISVFSGEPSAAASSSASVKTPAKTVVSVERLSLASHGRAVKQVTAAIGGARAKRH